MTYCEHLTRGTFSDHLKKLELVLRRLQRAGLKVNIRKSFFVCSQLECLGCWIARNRIKPVYDKVKAIMKIAKPKNRKELQSFIGAVNCYRDMWIRRSLVLATLAALTSKTTKWKWEPQHQKAFAMAKKVIAKETLLAYPDFNKPFQIHTDASHCQLGAVVSQEGKPIAFHSRKLNPAQTRYTTAERELLNIVVTSLVRLRSLGTISTTEVSLLYKIIVHSFCRRPPPGRFVHLYANGRRKNDTHAFMIDQSRLVLNTSFTKDPIGLKCEFHSDALLWDVVYLAPIL